MRILLVNDDGFRASGIQTLFAVLKKDHDVWLVAPDREVSAVGHAITLRQVIRFERISPRVVAVEGSPTDCVNLAIYVLMPERPDLILSGINIGWNLSEDVTYSGTVAGAFEGAVHRIPSIAISVPSNSDAFDPLLQATARWIKQNLESLTSAPIPRRVFLNINWPDRLKPLGVRITRLGQRLHENQVIERTDPRGFPYFWLSRGEPVWESGADIDVETVRAGYISLTPLTVDWTHEPTKKQLESWLESTRLEIPV